ADHPRRRRRGPEATFGSAPVIPFTIVVDPIARRGEVELVPPDGPFATAMRGLLARAEARRIPDRVLLELYAYEIVERMREHIAGGADTVVNVPFWPAAMMQAAGVEAHAARELLAMWPTPCRIVRRRADVAATAARQLETFGVALFEPAAYVAAALEDDPATAGQRAVGMLLCRDDQVLLERRPPTAAVYADCRDTPGGKLEAGESALDALHREAMEELDIAIIATAPLAIACEPDPTSARPFVHHVYLVTQWRGEPRNREGQQLEWRPASTLATDPACNPLLALTAPDLASAGRT
ncbi:MAG: NUDIX domain-containing protein, partial [Planctomycetes bacterium]|nr:NUDIX domain-containing protein [Planctomycetota bacterium]